MLLQNVSKNTWIQINLIFLVPCAPGCASGFTCTNGSCKCGTKACDVLKGFTCVTDACKCAKAECDSRSDTCDKTNGCICAGENAPCAEGYTCTNGSCKCGVKACVAPIAPKGFTCVKLLLLLM